MMQRIVIQVLIGLVLASPVGAQVAVAPTALFLSERSPFGALYISNPTTEAQEVTVGFRFGYPAADSTGAVAMHYDTSGAVARRSVAEHVRAFPQRFILQPGETQVVRLTASPPATGDGMYWARVVTTSSPQSVFAADTMTEGVRARVQFRLQQVTALFYRRGELDVRVGLGALEAVLDSGAVQLLAQLEHEGNSPFFGTARLRLLDADGRVVHDERQSIAVYVPERRRFRLALPSPLAAGAYAVELTLSAERSDLPQEQLVRMPPVIGTTRLTVTTDRS